MELTIVTNARPENINWRLTTKQTDETILYVRSGTYQTANAFEKEYVCLGYDTEYRFKIWANATDENGRLSYEGSYERKNTDIFKTINETLLLPETPEPSAVPGPD